MPGQVLRITDFERNIAEPPARAAGAVRPARIYEFPAPVQQPGRRSRGRRWRHALDIALRLELAGVLFLLIVWLLWHFGH